MAIELIVITVSTTFTNLVQNYYQLSVRTLQCTWGQSDPLDWSILVNEAFLRLLYLMEGQCMKCSRQFCMLSATYDDNFKRLSNSIWTEQCWLTLNPGLISCNWICAPGEVSPSQTCLCVYTHYSPPIQSLPRGGLRAWVDIVSKKLVFLNFDFTRLN